MSGDLLQSRECSATKQPPQPNKQTKFYNYK
jgi:hypothetical protein